MTGNPPEGVPADGTLHWDEPADGTTPPTVLAATTSIDIDPDEPIQWWRPGWRDVLPHIGWRWLFLALLVGTVLLMIAGMLWGLPRDVALILGAKAIFLISGAMLASGAYVAGRAVRARREPFCIFCGYSLSNLPDNHRCPECGRPYTWAVIAEYRRSPESFIARWNARRSLPPAPTPFAAGSTPRRRRSRDGTE